MKFMEKVNKDVEKAGINVGASEPPRYWFSTGNHVLNKVISGSFLRGVPQGRLLCFTGPAASGKSFLVGNALREAQKDGAYLVVVDSENALDNDFVSNIGVDVTKDYSYYDPSTISQCKRVVSSVLKGYRDEYGKDPDAPKILIVIDSLDMLMTDTEQDHFDKGVSKGDQGQRNKQLKAMLREFVQNTKGLNVSIIVTAQVYKNQDLLNGEGLYIVSEAIRFSLSQIVMITKLKLKKDSNVEGIRMKCEGYKTRFTKPYQTVTIEVPYDTGMDKYNGLLDVAIELGVIEAKGAWKNFGTHKWNSKEIPAEHLPAILEQCEARREKNLTAMIEDGEVDLTGNNPSAKSRRQAKADIEKNYTNPGKESR